MAACAVPPLPAPLTGSAFPEAAHVRLGDERRALGSAWKPLSHTHFPPRWGVHRRPPAPLPRSGQVLGSAGGGGGESRSEAHRALPERPLRAAAPFVPPEPGIRMHTAPRVCVPASETRERFCAQPAARRAPVAAGRRREDSVPCGDREKTGLLPSVRATSYPAREARPAARPWRSHRCDPTIKGDGQSYYHTSYQAQFTGEWNPPAKPSEKHTSIKFGDPRISGSMSEQKHAYSAPDKRTHRAYNKEHAVSQIQHVNVQLGDGCIRFSTSTSEQFPVYDVEPVTMVHPNQYASSIPRGDEDPERNRAFTSTTTTQLSYPETDCRNRPAKPDLLLHKHPTKLCLGDEHPSSRLFSTTQQLDYQPPQQSERVMADSRSHRESHIPFNYHTDECSVTTMKATLVPHRQQKQRPSEEMLQQIKYSHLGLPWRAQDLFRTEQKEQFTPKFRGPADIQKTNFQVSCIPLGTLKRYCPQRKVHFMP